MKETIIEYDPTFNEAMFLTRVNNVFMLLHTAIMTDNLNLVKHYLSDDLEVKYQGIIDNNKQNNVIQVFDEFNVKISSIRNVEVLEDKILIDVSLTARYMDYKLYDTNYMEINIEESGKCTILGFPDEKECIDLFH